MKNNKGITLIALVITIIVMLILVAVTITIAVNGGLFNYAKNAGVDTNTRIAEEQEYATLRDNMTSDDLIAKYTGGWYEKEDGVFTNGKSTVKLGDYINYQYYNDDIDEDDLTYTSPASKSGVTEDQTFTITENDSNVKWKVLGTENGNLLIIAGGGIEFFELKGQNGYNNGTKELNNLCSIYGHGTNADGARSVNADDIIKIFGIEMNVISEQDYIERGDYIEDDSPQQDLIMDDNDSDYWIATQFIRVNNNLKYYCIGLTSEGGYVVGKISLYDSNNEETDIDYLKIRPVVKIQPTAELEKGTQIYGIDSWNFKN